jgi:RimJ/RimL family protein N-acetyltransferase
MSDRCFIPIATKRLRLRAFRAGDEAAFLAYRADPEVSRYQSWDGCTPADAAAFVAEMAAHDADIPGTWYQIAVARKDDDAVLGDLALHTSATDRRQVEIGYSLGSAHQGQGYATEAVAALLDFVFERLGKHRAIAAMDTRNHRSVALVERLGFRREAHFLEHCWFKGAWSDEYAYALLAREWSLRRAA